jgi:hypothetical protein
VFDPSCSVRLDHVAAAQDPTATAIVVHAVRAWVVPAFEAPSPAVRLAAVGCFVDLLRQPVEAREGPGGDAAAPKVGAPCVWGGGARDGGKGPCVAARVSWGLCVVPRP